MKLTRAVMLLLAWMLTSVSLPGAEDRDLPTIFEEKFTDNPHSRFRVLPVTSDGSSSGNGKYDEVKHAYTLGGYLTLVRPVSAGAHVELNITLRFVLPQPGSPAVLQTDLMLVLMDKTMAGVQILRPTKADAPAMVKFVHQTSGDEKAKVLKEVPLQGTPDGTWLLRYRHGLLTLVQGTRTVGSADLSRLGVAVAGVSWTQKGGDVSCESMTLKGEPARKLEQADQQALQRASQLNMEARRLLNEKKADEALTKMEEASSLYFKVHGEKHHDFGNSLTNLAYILESTGKNDEAEKQLTRALSIHEAVLGTTHPHTTLTRFNLGKNCMNRGDQAKAKELWTKCRDDWKNVLGPDYPLVKSLDSILSKL